MNLLIRSKDGRLELSDFDVQDDCVSFIEQLEDQLERGEIDINTAIDLINDYNATSKEVSIRTRVHATIRFEIDHSKTIRSLERKLKLLKSLTRGMK